MRTTLNLDDDVAAELIDEAKRRGSSQSRAANELIRAGLRASRQPTRAARYTPPTFDTGRVLLDVTDVGEALEVLGDGR